MRAVGSFNDARDYTKAELVTAWRKLAWRIAVDIYPLKTPLEISTWEKHPLESLLMINWEVVGAFLTLAHDA